MLPGKTVHSEDPDIRQITCDDCGTEMGLEVLQSAAGYYLGYWCSCGPYSRESGYYKTREEAQQALDTDTVAWRV